MVTYSSAHFGLELCQTSGTFDTIEQAQVDVIHKWDTSDFNLTKDSL